MERRAVSPAKEGLVAGLLLYATVALFFALANVLTGESAFRTAAVLGAPLLPEAAPGTGGAVLAFNGVHLAGSLLLGMAASVFTGAVERFRRAWYVFFFVFVAGSIVAILALGIVMAEVSHVLPWSWVTLAHLVGAGVVAGFLGWAHRPARGS